MRPEIHKSSINGERDGKERDIQNNLKKQEKNNEAMEGAKHRQLKVGAKAKAKVASSSAHHLTSRLAAPSLG